MKYTRVYHDEQGETHFETVNVTGEKTEVGLMSDQWFPKTMTFRDSAGVDDFDWHNAPQSLFIVMLEGKVEIEVSDGDKRIFETGDVLLMEDTAGKGHRSSSPDGKGRSTLLIFMDE